MKNQKTETLKALDIPESLNGIQLANEFVILIYFLVNHLKKTYLLILKVFTTKRNLKLLFKDSTAK